jgi:MFS family permease
LLHATAEGVYFLGFSVFFLPLRRDFQISSAATSLPFTMARLVSTFVDPGVGVAADRFGPAKVALFGGLLAGSGYVLLGMTHSYALFVLAFVIAITPGIRGGFDTPGFVAINRWFTGGQSMAFALASTGFAFGGAAIVPLVALGVDRFGWRTITLIVGIAIYMMVPLVSLVLGRSPPEDDPGGVGETESGATRTSPVPRTASPDGRPASRSYSVREALMTRSYWFLAVSYGLRGTVWSMFTVHLVPIMVWKGLEEARAGILIGAYPLLRIPTQVLAGWAATRWPKPRLAAAGALIGSSGFFLLAWYTDANAWQMLAVFALLATNEGSWPLAWSMITEQFGRSNFGALRGVLLATLSFMGLGAPLYAGWVFDKTESYLWVVLPAGFVLILAAILNLLAFPPARSRAGGKALRSNE